MTHFFQPTASSKKTTPRTISRVNTPVSSRDGFNTAVASLATKREIAVAKQRMETRLFINSLFHLEYSGAGRLNGGTYNKKVLWNTGSIDKRR